MKLRYTFAAFAVTTLASQGAVIVTGTDMDYGISNTNSNTFGLDFSTKTVYTAGSERSDNGDQNNNRSGRVFVEFQLTAGMIVEAANAGGASASIAFDIVSIGSGVTGTPYTDDLDLRYLGTSVADRSAQTLWGTGGVNQENILSVSGPTGASTVLLVDASIISDIAAATTGDYIAFAFLNRAGTLSALPVGNSTAETYGFQVNTDASNHTLTVTAVPEPSSAALLGLGGLALILRRRK